MPSYTWLTQTLAIQALQARLNNTGFWSAAELWQYISEGLRLWNGLCEIWNADVTIAPATGQWINTGTLSTSPRLRTVTDQALYSQMLNMLLEPQLTGGVTWTGTSQFTLANLQYCLQKRVQEVIQASSCNVQQLSPLNSIPGTRTYSLPDTVLEQRRTRFLAVMANTTGSASSGSQSIAVASSYGVFTGQVLTGTGIQAGAFVTGVSGNTVSISLPTTAALSTTQLQFSQPVTLTREDTQSFQSFEPNYLQTVGLPQSWEVASEPPLGFSVDLGPSVPGTFDILALNAAETFSPPAATLLGIPNDWSWLPMYGALADVLGMESEATDRQRSAYCRQRYTQGLELFKQSNWLLDLTINGQSTDTLALADMDGWSTGWQESTWSLPSVVQAGMDMIAPTPGIGLAVGLTLLGNAPLLDPTGTLVQVSRDDWNFVLLYAQHVACFKDGGQEFSDTMPMLTEFFQAAADRNKRWLTYGIYVDILHKQGKLQDEAEPRE